MPAVFSSAFIIGAVDPAAEADVISEGRLVVDDVYSWLGEAYPASEYTLAFTGTEEFVRYEYDETALELDATAHTVNGIERGNIYRYGAFGEL